MKYVVLFLALISVPVFACNTDYECGYGNRCVKPWGTINQGQCVRPVTQNGLPIYAPPTPTIRPHQVSRCSFDTQCGIGETCSKGPYDIYGVCVR